MANSEGHLKEVPGGRRRGTLRRFQGAAGGLGKLGHTLFLFSLPCICINLSKNVDLTLSLRESVERTSYVWPYPAVNWSVKNLVLR